MNQQDLNAKRAINNYLKGLNDLKEHEKAFSNWLKQLPADNISNSTNQSLITGLSNLCNTYFKNAKHEHKAELEQKLKHIYHDMPQKADSALNYLNTTGGNIFDLATKKVALKKTCKDMGKYFDRHSKQDKDEAKTAQHACHTAKTIKSGSHSVKVTCLFNDDGKLLAIFKEEKPKNKQNADQKILFNTAKSIKHNVNEKFHRLPEMHQFSSHDDLQTIEQFFDKLSHEVKNKLQPANHDTVSAEDLSQTVNDFFNNLTDKIKAKAQSDSHEKVSADDLSQITNSFCNELIDKIKASSQLVARKDADIADKAKEMAKPEQENTDTDKTKPEPKAELNKAQVMPADAKTPALKVKRTKQAHRYPDKAAYKYIMRNLKRRGVTVREMAEEAMHDQEKHGVTIGVEEYEQAIYSVLHKRDNMSQIMRGLVLDDLCTGKLLPDPLQYIMENDLSSFSDDEVLGISLTAPYSGIAVTNFGARDVHKSGIAKRLDEDPDHCNVFADDIVSAIVGNAEAIVAHKYNF